MAPPPYIARVTNFTRDANAGLESPSPLGVDAELNAAYTVINQLVLRHRAITNADGTLKNFAPGTAQSLAGVEDFTATASQTNFVTGIVWNAAFTTDNVWAFRSLSRIDVVSVADDGNGFLEVELAAQSAGAEIQIAAFESGAGILSRLQTISATDGAFLVAVYDGAGLYDAVTVEGALEEVMTDLNDLITDIGSPASLIRSDGSVDFAADQSMDGFKITDAADGVDPQDYVTVAQLSAASTEWSALASYFLRLDGTNPMGADLDHGGFKATNMANGVAADDGATISQLEDQMPRDGSRAATADANMGGFKITNGAPAVAATDFVTLSQAQGLAAPFSRCERYTVAGTDSFDVPAGVTKIRVLVFGAGGGGKFGSPIPNNYGGGGGAFVEAVIDVTPLETLTVVVGTGGTGSSSPTVGGSSKITRISTDLVTAGGGGRGERSTDAGSGGVASVDASIVNYTAINGGRGEQCIVESSSNFEGNGGNCPSGGQGGTGYKNDDGDNTAAQNGTAPGGGGGGGSTAASGSGAAGAVYIWY